MASKNSLSTVADGDNLPKNFSWVIPGVLAGCAAPKSAAELKSLEKIGISLLITLSSDSPPHNSIILLRKPRHETFACKNFEGIPVPVLLKITASIEKEILRKGKVAIHCMGGNGRTGTALAAFFMKSQGMTAEEAIKIIRHTRPRSIETRSQETCLQEYQNFLNTDDSRDTDQINHAN